MITIYDSLEWLNQFDRSHLNAISQELIATAKNQRAVNEIVKDIVTAALGQARMSPRDSLDYSEALLNSAVIEFNRGFKEQAEDHTYEAKRCYEEEKDLHRSAIASWMCGITELSLLQTDSSFDYWKEAIATFEQLQLRSKHVLSTHNWYTAALGKMNQDLVTLPQESFCWLNDLTPSTLSKSNYQFVETVDESIRRKQFDRAYQTITILKEISKNCPDPLEAPEILVETGLAAYRMGNWLLAMQDLKLAAIKFPPCSHKHDVVNWMLGSIQWWYKDERVSAVRNWKKSLDGFGELSNKADHGNLNGQKCWYQEKIILMQEALKGKIAEYYS